VTYLYRRIFKSELTGSATMRELLQSMFVAEMLKAGGTIWVVSPWVSDVLLIDNRSGNFDSLNPEWGRREIHLADVLVGLMSRGTEVNVVTRNEESNKVFLNKLRDLVQHHALEDRVNVKIHAQLHTKGILLSRSLLIGSMNLTYSGLTINDEWIEFSLDQQDLARTKLEFARYLGTP
jgi:phosphatidylserine/phosphatidylglycerophosphate/cardiolipin synthase-like enzyme